MGSKKSFLTEDAPSYASVVVGTVVFLNLFMVVVAYSYLALDWCWEKFKAWAAEEEQPAENENAK